MKKQIKKKIISYTGFDLSGNMAALRSCKSIAVAVCVSFILLGIKPVAASEVSDHNLQIQELQRQNEATSIKLKELQTIMEKTLKEQKAATVASDPATAQKIENIENRQAVLEEKTKSTPILEKGSFPRSWRVAGTDTSVRLGGIIILDGQYDFGPKGGPAASFIGIPMKGTTSAERTGVFRAQSNPTRLLLDVRRETKSLGLARAYVESDFSGSANTMQNSTTKLSTSTGDTMATNAYVPRLRYAYLQVGRWELGQSDTTFLDYNSLAFFIDQTGPTGLSKIRQPLVRYTLPLEGLGQATGANVTNPWGNQMANFRTALQFSIESPEGDFTAQSGELSTNTTGTAYSTSASDMPDLLSRFILDRDWGRVTLAGLFRRIRVDDGKGNKPVENGYGTQLGYMFHMKTLSEWFGKDKLHGTVAYGRGAGRYITDTVNSSATAVMTGTSITNFNLQTQTAGTLAYTRWWTDQWSSSFGYGRTHINTNDDAVPKKYLQSDTESFHGNLIWRPTILPGMVIGAEYIWGRRQMANDQEGQLNRLQMSCLYFF